MPEDAAQVCAHILTTICLLADSWHIKWRASYLTTDTPFLMVLSDHNAYYHTLHIIQIISFEALVLF